MTPPWLHPWIRVQLAVRAILTTPWPPGVWPSIKDDVSRALALRERLRKATWWN